MKKSAEVPEPRGNRNVALARQRERTLSILTEAFVSNLIEVEEFERRVAGANAARNLPELVELIEDLPASVEPSAAAGLAGEAPVTTSPARKSTPRLREEEQPLWGFMTSHRYRGSHWLRSGRVGLRTLMSSLELDFRELPLPPRTIQIDIACLMSSVILTVPEDLPVEMEVVPLMGSIQEDRRVRSAGLRPQGGALLRVTGFAVMSEVRVRTR